MAWSLSLPAIREIIFRDWNPIGVEPKDAAGEYESYVGKIAALAEQEDAYKLAAYLDDLERNMGLDADTARNGRVAATCVALFKNPVG